MSNVGSTLLECPDVQAELDRYFTTCNHTGHRESPFLQWLASDANNSGLNQVINPGGAKTRTVTLRYDQKIATSSVNEINSCTLDCVSTNQVGDMSATYEMDICNKLSYDEGYSVYDLAAICRSNPDFIMSRINAMALAIEAKAAEQMAEEVTALIGAWASDVSNVTGHVLSVATLLSGGINPDMRFLSKINLAAKKTGYCTDSAIFGSSMLWEAADLMNTGCCASNGIDLWQVLQRYGRAILWDPYIVAAFNNDDRNAVMTQLGALQMLVYTLGREAHFEPIASARAGNFEVIPMMTPRYSVPFDLIVSNNCGTLSIFANTSLKLVSAPLDMFPLSDPQTGVNFVNEIQVVNP